MENIDRQIEAVLDKIRPFLQREGGDLEYYGFKDGVVYLRMIGACQGCLYMDQDLSAGVEIILMEEVSGVIRCDASGEVPPDVMEGFFARQKEKRLEGGGGSPLNEPDKNAGGPK